MHLGNISKIAFCLIVAIILSIVVANTTENKTINIQKGHLIMKKININRDYDKLYEYCEYIYDEAEEYEDDYYLFDTQRYKFVHCSKVKNENDRERYIATPKFDPSYSMIDFYLKMSGNREDIKDYIFHDDDIENICIRFRTFLDYNGFEDYDDDGYDEYKVFTKIFIDWCKENNISYVFKMKSPPKGYDELEQHFDNYEWEIPPINDNTM